MLREKQLLYNEQNGITPETIYKTTEEIIQATAVADVNKKASQVAEPQIEYGSLEDKEEILKHLEKEMRAAAANLEFERAAVLRDEIKRLKKAK